MCRVRTLGASCTVKDINVKKRCPIKYLSFSSVYHVGKDFRKIEGACKNKVLLNHSQAISNILLMDCGKQRRPMATVLPLAKG